MTPRLYKAAEVCELADVQPYVLRSWEKEFPGIGVQKSPDSPRLYRPSDVEQVRRIRQLVFGEGLTLAGARRRLEQSAPAPVAHEDEIAEVLDALGADVRERIAVVRNGLRSLLDALSGAPGSMALAAAPGVEGPPLGRPASQPRAAKRKPRPVPAKRAVATKRSAPARKTKRRRASA